MVQVIFNIYIINQSLELYTSVFNSRYICLIVKNMKKNLQKVNYEVYDNNNESNVFVVTYRKAVGRQTSSSK